MTYIPETEDVRECYSAAYLCPDCDANFVDYIPEMVPDSGKEFDLWLEKHDREVSAKALRDFAVEVAPADRDPEFCHLIYDPWDVADLLNSRADDILGGPSV